MNFKLYAAAIASLSLALSLSAQPWTVNGDNVYPTLNGGTQRKVAIGVTSVGSGQQLRVTGVAEFDTVRGQKRIVAYEIGRSSRLDPDRIVTKTATDSTVILPNSITTNAIYVGTEGWSITAPDYVFDHDYKLMPLSKVEKFVAENKHLPGVMSSRKMEEKGSVDLVEMNLKLLQKVEEMTLYLIDQKKEIDALKTELKNGN